MYLVHIHLVVRKFLRTHPYAEIKYTFYSLPEAVFRRIVTALASETLAYRQLKVRVDPPGAQEVVYAEFDQKVEEAAVVS